MSSQVEPILPRGITITTKKLTVARTYNIEFPDYIQYLTNLTELDIKAKITSLPESIGNLTKLTELDLEDNQLTSLPESIGYLTNLTYLTLNNNQLKSLPESIGNLKNLTYLTLNNNQLKSLPESIGNLTELTALYINQNTITSLPESIGNLTKLERLEFTDNKLTSLPESIGNLANLIYLYISWNPITSLPNSIRNLTNVKLYLNNKPYNVLSKTVKDLIQKPTTEYNDIKNILFNDPIFSIDDTPLDDFLTKNEIDDYNLSLKIQFNQNNNRGKKYFIFNVSCTEKFIHEKHGNLNLKHDLGIILGGNCGVNLNLIDDKNNDATNKDYVNTHLFIIEEGGCVLTIKEILNYPITTTTGGRRKKKITKRNKRKSKKRKSKKRKSKKRKSRPELF